MKNPQNLRYVFFLSLIAFGLIQILLSIKNNQLNYQQQKEFKNHKYIEKCIDIENKNKRTFYENINLSEYCINKFGNIKRNSNMKIYKK